MTEGLVGWRCQMPFGIVGIVIELLGGLVYVLENLGEDLAVLLDEQIAFSSYSFGGLLAAELA